MRLPSRERRQAIVTAVQGAFADKGFDGTTTRELARAAGVSEALLYKHFPSKESLYVAMLEACADGPMAAEFTRVLALPPSTSTLVALVHFLTSHFVLCEDLQKTTMHRLALRSLLEDAEFVRLGAKQFGASWIRKVEACIAAAVKAGDLKATPVRARPARLVRPPPGVRADAPSASRRFRPSTTESPGRRWSSKLCGSSSAGWVWRRRRSGATITPRLCRISRRDAAGAITGIVMNLVSSIVRPSRWPARPLAGVGLLALALAACQQQAQPAFERPPAPVAVAAAIARDTPLYIDAVGKAVANEVVSVQPQISGRIVKIHFADGADLKQGDLLFSIDPRPVQATVQQAEANVARDQAQARQAEANAARDQAAVQQAQAALTQARAQLAQAEANVVRSQAQLENAQAQDRRYSELFRQGYVAREQSDQVRTAMETAAATLRADQAMIENGKAAIAAAEASLAQARAAVVAGQAAVENARATVRANEAMVDSARLQLAYTEIRAPIDGRAGQRLVDLGNVVTANTGSLLMIQRLDPIYAEFTVTENDLTEVQRHMRDGRLGGGDPAARPGRTP